MTRRLWTRSLFVALKMFNGNTIQLDLAKKEIERAVGGERVPLDVVFTQQALEHGEGP